MPAIDPQRGVSIRRLGVAPHRLMFFAGATNVLLSMMWWATWLVASRWPSVFAMKYPPVFPGWVHAFVMLYQVLPAFFFGFLLTTVPKWTKQPEITRRQFLPVGASLFVGQLATIAGAFGSHTAIVVGVSVTLVGWIVGLALLAPMAWREEAAWHARSCVGGLVLGLAGVVAFGAVLVGASPTWVLASIKVGTFGMALVVFFTVAHRMFPFFASNVVAGYQPWRPTWLLAAVWVAIAVRLVLSLASMTGALWLPDAMLLGLASIACWRWWPRRSMPGLLAVLFVSLTWLPVAMALYVVDDLHYVATGMFSLGRAPAHALFIGFFGSALVAMVTRVTQGHSGRPLVMPAIAWFAFAAVQVVAVVRIAADLARDPYAWFAIAAIGWIIAFGPWVLRLARIYLSPRADSKPG